MAGPIRRRRGQMWGVLLREVLFYLGILAVFIITWTVFWGGFLLLAGPQDSVPLAP